MLEILNRLDGGEGVLHQVRMSVNDSGRLDLYQWLYFLGQHARRHLSQMTANKSEWQHQVGRAAPKIEPGQTGVMG